MQAVCLVTMLHITQNLLSSAQMVLRGITVTMQSKAQHIAAQQGFLIMAGGERDLNCLVCQLNAVLQANDNYLMYIYIFLYSCA